MTALSRIILLAAAFLPSLQAAEDAVQLLERMSRTYYDIELAFAISAEIREKTESAGDVDTSRQRVRFVECGANRRADLLQGGNPSIVRLSRDGNILLYLVRSRLYSEHPENEGAVAETREAIRELRRLLYDRFVHLAPNRPRILSSKPARLRAGGTTRQCLRIRIGAPEASPRGWTGELWVDTATALVWRSTLDTRTLERKTQLRIDFQSIERGKATPCAELDFRPPPGAEFRHLLHAR